MALQNKTCLITCGPTWIEIDQMRILANRSTGSLGQMLAIKLAQSGAKVTLLEGPVTSPLQTEEIRIKKFTFFKELHNLLKRELQKPFDCIIHAAAVSDFKLTRPLRGKIPSDTPRLTLTFVPTPKLIKMIRRKAPNACLVGFKLESSCHENILTRAARKSLKENHCDLLVANSLSDGYTGYIVDRSGQQVSACSRSRRKLVNTLVNILERTL